MKNKNQTTAKVTTTTTPDLTHHTPGPVGTQPLSKQQLRDLYLRNQRQVKLTAKQNQKAATTAKRADGIIGTLSAALELGTTKKEIMDALTVKFADRDPLGMVVTVGIQLSRLAKTTGRTIVKTKVEGRGNVYQYADKVPAPVTVTEDKQAA